MKMKRAVRMPLNRGPRRRPPAAPLRARAATAEEAYDEEDYGAEDEPNMKFSHALMVVLALHVIAVGGVFAFNWMKTRQTTDTKSTSKTPPAAETAAAAEAAPAPAPKTTAARPENWTGKTHTVQAGETLTRIASIHKTTVEAIEKENGITSYSMIRVGQVLKIPGHAASKAETAKPAEDEAAKKAFLATKAEAAKPATASNAGTISALPATAVKPAKTATAEATPKPSPSATAAPAAASGNTYVVQKGDNPYTIAKKLHVSYNDLLKVNGIKDATKIQIGQKLKVPKAD